MGIPNKFIFPSLPLVIPAGTSKIDSEKIISQAISSFFWKRLEDIYEEEKVKGQKYRTKIALLVETNKFGISKVEKYVSEGSFLKFVMTGFQNKSFYPTIRSYDKNIVLAECKIKRNSSQRIHIKLWLGLLKDVKDNFSPQIYINFLKMYLPLYMLMIGVKHSALALELFDLISVNKSQEKNLLILQYLNLEDTNVRNIVVKKLEKFSEKGLKFIDLIKFMREKKIIYPEFEKYTDIYKNFDTGFTDTIQKEMQTVEKISLNINSLEKNFPLLIKGKKSKIYNEIMECFLRLLEDFNVEIMFYEKFDKGDVDNFSFIIKGSSQIDGISIVEIMEEVLLFITDQYNTYMVDPDMMDKVKIYTQSLILELTIPQNTIKSKAVGIKF